MWNFAFVVLLHLASMLACSTGLSSLEDDSRMPFYVIAHMANRIADVHRFLQDGANAVETDVTFSADGRPTSTYHGFPCDCWRFCFWSQTFSSYLTSIRRLILGSRRDRFVPDHVKRLALLYLDLKTSRFDANVLRKVSHSMAESITRHFIGNGLDLQKMPWIILGVPDVSDGIIFKEFRSKLTEKGYAAYLPKFGFDVYGRFKDTAVVLKTLARHNLTGNMWMGDGMSNCFPSAFRVRSNLGKLVQMRDARRMSKGCDEEALPAGVYSWTVDKASELRSILKFEVNGIVTNTPATLMNVLKEEMFAGYYRLATVKDRPWN